MNHIVYKQYLLLLVCMALLVPVNCQLRTVCTWGRTWESQSPPA